MPRGGKRRGAGRKPKNKTAKLLQHPSAQAPVPTTNGPSPIEEFDAPDDLTADERAIWLKQAPHAFANRTLTRASALAFERYCKVAVLERNEAKSSGVSAANHRGLLKQVNAFELQFMLCPNGKAMPSTDQAVGAADPDDAFFGDVSGASKH
jgi:hypothetical protein